MADSRYLLDFCCGKAHNSALSLEPMDSFVMRKLSCAVVLLLIASWGCHKKAPAPVPVPPPVSAPKNAPPAITPRVPAAPSAEPLAAEPPPRIITAPNFFDMAELNFREGKYKQAAQSFEAFLSSTPKSADRDRALFHLGMARALAKDSSRDLRQAEAAFRRLIAEFPQSPYRDPAELILGFQDQIEKLRADVRERDERIKRLSDELQKLKEIDMQRRPAARTTSGAF